jgi:hypothetical protein
MIPVTPKQLAALAATAPKVVQEPPFRRTADSHGFDISQWLTKYDIAVKHKAYYEGGYKWVLEACPFDPAHGQDSAVFEARDGRLGFRCLHNGCNGRNWHDLRELFEPKAQRSKRQQSRAKAPVTAQTNTAGSGDLRPSIDVDEKDLPVIRASAWEALTAANRPIPHLFRHGGLIARLTRDDHGTPVLGSLDVPCMVHEMSNAALWVKIVQTKEGEVEIPQHPPEIVARDLRADPNPPLPVIVRIVQSPVFAPNGSLSVTPGYDAASRTYFDAPGGFALPAVPERPTAAEVAAARTLIVGELLGDFPFAERADRANAVALLLLPFTRDLIDGPTPLHLVEAPSPGSGKGLLVDALTRIATGRAPGIMTPAPDDAEWRKKITSHLRNAPSCLLIDNISKPLDSDALAGALTATTWEDRLLGTNDQLRVPVRCTWIATGNNPTVSTDLARRIVRIRLQPPVDRPWERDGTEFRHPHLGAWVMEQRSALLHACLLLGQAWIAAGKPVADITLGSYEYWAAVMGGILNVAGIGGFLENRQSFYEAADAEGTIWRAFVSTWWETYQDKPVGVAELRSIAEATEGMYLGKSDLLRSQQTALGKQLIRYRDRVLGDYRIVSAGTHRRAAVWRLLPTDARQNGQQAAVGVNLVNLGEPPESNLRTRDHDAPNMRARALGDAPPCISGTGLGRFTQVHEVHQNGHASPVGDRTNGADRARIVDWQPTGDGWERIPADTPDVTYACPPGLDYRLNANAGTREARIPVAVDVGEL